MTSTVDQGVLAIGGTAVARLQKLTISQEPGAIHEIGGMGYSYPFSVEADSFKAGTIDAEKMFTDKVWADYLHNATVIATMTLTITKEDGTTQVVTLTDVIITAQKTTGSINEVIMETVQIKAAQFVWS